MSNLLVLALLLPLAGAIIVCLVGRDYRSARQSALVTTLFTMALALVLCYNFATLGNTAQSGGVFAEKTIHWLKPNSGLDIALGVGLDGLSAWLFGLSALLMLTSVLISWEAIRQRATAFYALMLILESGILGVFAARDLILFYIFFEFTLIPLFFLIGIWGSEERRYAAIKFFIFTLTGSMLTFVGLLAIVLWCRQAAGGPMTFSIQSLTATLASHPMPQSMQLAIFLALFAGFAIKVPLFPLHTWLPLAHVQAPAAGSVVLAGILLKIGTYGFLRFSMPMLPLATALCAPYLLWLSVAGIVYGALVALAQKDMKRLIAYSSVSHLGFCMLGLFSLNRLGLQGGTLQMINHGLSTGGLFACVGMLYERYHTRRISDLGGLSRRMPVLAFFMLVFTLSSIGLPGLNGFVGEFLILLGMFDRGFDDAPLAWHEQFQVIEVLAVSGVVLGAWYMLWLMQRVFFGPLKEPAGHEGSQHAPAASDASSAMPPAHGDSPHVSADLSLREVFALAPLVVLMVWIGIAPNTFLQPMSGSINEVTATVERSFDNQYKFSPPLADVDEHAEPPTTSGPITSQTPATTGIAATGYQLPATNNQ